MFKDYYTNPDGMKFMSSAEKDRSEIVIAKLKLRLIEEALNKYDPAVRAAAHAEDEYYEGFNCVINEAPDLIRDIREIISAS